jgi:hypothetical protein
MFDNHIPVGIEVEVEGVREFEFGGQSLWASIEDGSLRNHGREFVSIPLKGEAIPLALTMLREFLENWNKNFDFSERTSVHVHVNVRDMTVEQLFNYVICYLTFEPVIYKYVFDLGKRDRESNIFCLPVGNSVEFLSLPTAFYELEEGKGKGAVSYLAANWHKYTGLNLKPITKLGTVEFRHMTGLLQVRELCEWINILLCMRKFACSLGYEDLKAEVLELNTNSRYEFFLQRVFKNLSANLLRYNIKEELEKGVVSVKRVLSVSQDTYLGAENRKPYKDRLKAFLQNSSMKQYLEGAGVKFSQEAIAANKAALKKEVESLKLRVAELTKQRAETHAEFQRLRGLRQAAEGRWLRAHDAGQQTDMERIDQEIRTSRDQENNAATSEQQIRRDVDIAVAELNRVMGINSGQVVDTSGFEAEPAWLQRALRNTTRVVDGVVPTVNVFEPDPQVAQQIFTWEAQTPMFTTAFGDIPDPEPTRGETDVDRGERPAREARQREQLLRTQGRGARNPFRRRR